MENSPLIPYTTLLLFRGVKIKHSMLWWKLQLPYRKKKLLCGWYREQDFTKRYPTKREGWSGIAHCHLCPQSQVIKSRDYIFLLWPYMPGLVYTLE